ncbi:F-box protein CPR1-like [Cornus florida]|uniref:F-box protein CPR1-like n=1 Tax=Cornus florida TaxID=4283 RepID=UPI0028970DB0|nr:F-box protein CPR1-like [Cornus florida]
MMTRGKKRNYQSIEAPMSNIPDDLIPDVLCRLPVKSLLRFRCVSKQWRALIDSPNFINLHLNQSLRTNTNWSLISRRYSFQNLYCIGYQSLDDILKHGYHNVLPVKHEYPFLRLPHHFNIVGYCNGLMCLLSSTLSSIKAPILLNPSTKKHQILPPEPQIWSSYPVYGFGYDAVTDDYKIVRVSRFVGEGFGPEVVVFSSRLNKWRMSPHCVPHFLRHNFSGVFFNGALHWVATRQHESPLDNYSIYIVAFDLVVENFREVKLPNHSDYETVTLGVSGGCLWAGWIDDDNHVQLWVMKDYMVQESWTKRSLSFSSQVCKILHRCRVRILAYSSSSSEVLVMEINNQLHWLDLKQHKVVHLDIPAYEKELFIASLVKLPCDRGNVILLRSNLWRRVHDNFSHRLRYEYMTLLCLFVVLCIG